MQTEQYEVNWKNYYDILGLSPKANAQEIKSAYRRLARKYHPDRAKDSLASDRMAEINEAYKRLVHLCHHSLSGRKIKESRLFSVVMADIFSVIMADINEAYEVLSDPVRRARYDQVFKVKHYSQAAEAKKPTKEEGIGLVAVIAQVAKRVIRELTKNRRVSSWGKVSKRVVWAAVLSVLLIMVGGTSLAFAQPDHTLATPFKSVTSTVAEEALDAISLIEEAREVVAAYERSIVSTQLQAMRVIEDMREVPSVTGSTNDMTRFPSPDYPLFPNYLGESHSQFRYTVDSRGNVSVDTSVATTDAFLDKIKRLLIRLAAGEQIIGSSSPVTSSPAMSVPVRGSIPSADTALEHCQRGIALTNEGHYEQAVAEFNKAIELDPNKVTAYFGRGIAYKEQGKKDEAIADFEKIISLTNNPQLIQVARQQIRKLGTQTVLSSAPLSSSPVTSVPVTMSTHPVGEEFVSNGDFARMLTGWEVSYESQNPIYEESYYTERNGEHSKDGRSGAGGGLRLLQYDRWGYNDTGHVLCYQPLDINVSDYAAIYLTADVMVISNSLKDSGSWSYKKGGWGEYPCHLWIQYEGTDGVFYWWSHGFLPDTDSYKRPDYTQVTLGEWYHYKSCNLVDIRSTWSIGNVPEESALPKRITEIRIGGTGWDFEGQIDNVSLRGIPSVKEQAVPPPTEEEAALLEEEVMTEEEEIVLEEEAAPPEETAPSHTPTTPPTPTIVTFAQENLKAAIRDALGKPPGEDITVGELADLTQLDASRRCIADLTGIEYCTNLTKLDLGYNQISDLSPLASLTNLRQLDLGRNQISDLSPLASLTNLTKLYLGGNQISDLSPLVSLTNLRQLDLWGNQISDLSPVASLTNLTALYLESNQISDLSPVASLTNLTALHLGSNQISDLSPLASLTNLTRLLLGSNQISDLSPLVSLTNLKQLDLRNNQISDLSPLASLTNLTRLLLGDNRISDLSPLVENSGLGKGDEVWLKYNNLDLSEGSEDLENIRLLEERGVIVRY